MHTKIIFFVIWVGSLVIVGCGPQRAYAPEGTRTMVAQVAMATDTPVPAVSSTMVTDPAATVSPTDIPPTDTPTVTPLPTIPTATPLPTATPQTHTIQYGETLSKVAQRYDTTTETLRRLNGIRDEHEIWIGQELVVDGVVIDRKIVVDVSDQYLVAYENDEPVSEFVVSTGREGSETLIGDFYIENHIDSAWGETWGIEMPYWMGFYWANGLQNGFHGQPVNKDGIRMWEGYVGTPVSYGCIVMADDNASWLYEWARVGTAVTIQQ